MCNVVVDNDVLIKGSGYELLKEIIEAIPANEEDVGILGAARYSVPKYLEKLDLNKENEAAISQFEKLASYASVIEPTEDESRLAGELEFQAQKRNLPLDIGESQLLAVLKFRSLNKMATGDKQAIASMEVIMGDLDCIEEVRGKIICLEQLLFILVKNFGQKVCDSVCREPQIDKTFEICFCCHRTESTSDEWLEGLESYIRDIREKAPLMLSP